MLFVGIYFLFLVVGGNYVILNVFLAIAVDCLDALLEALKETKHPEKQGTKYVLFSYHISVYMR